MIVAQPLRDRGHRDTGIQPVCDPIVVRPRSAATSTPAPPDHQFREPRADHARPTVSRRTARRRARDPSAIAGAKYLRTVLRSMPSAADNLHLGSARVPVGNISTKSSITLLLLAISALPSPSRRMQSEPPASTQHRADTPPRVGNYVTARVGNYVTDNPSNLGNYVTADTRMSQFLAAIAIMAGLAFGAVAAGAPPGNQISLRRDYRICRHRPVRRQ